MPLEQHPTDPDKVVYVGRNYGIPQLQGVTTTQRPWVGLTDEEKKEIYRLSVYVEGAISLTEAKLKEKNT